MMIAKTWKWMQLWLLIKPHLKCTQFSKFKKQFEDQIAEAEANIGTRSAFRLLFKMTPISAIFEHYGHNISGHYC